jgi:hypothetical protein
MYYSFFLFLEGVDLISFINSPIGIILNFSNNSISMASNLNSSIVNFENVEGSNYSDNLFLD